MAYVLEGREGRQRRKRGGGGGGGGSSGNNNSTAGYKKLENNLEEALPSLDANTSKQNLVY